ncbi:hypothetical protein EV360DRAFT_66280 [Lentinula raphanica]|nr:hypothetical protein EV360DRAFT_66280 [Lentinula raphanica]
MYCFQYSAWLALLLASVADSAPLPLSISQSYDGVTANSDTSLQVEPSIERRWPTDQHDIHCAISFLDENGAVATRPTSNEKPSAQIYDLVNLITELTLQGGKSLSGHDRIQNKLPRLDFTTNFPFSDSRLSGPWSFDFECTEEVGPKDRPTKSQLGEYTAKLFDSPSLQAVVEDRKSKRPLFDGSLEPHLAKIVSYSIDLSVWFLVEDPSHKGQWKDSTERRSDQTRNGDNSDWLPKKWVPEKTTQRVKELLDSLYRKENGYRQKVNPVFQNDCPSTVCKNGLDDAPIHIRFEKPSYTRDKPKRSLYGTVEGAVGVVKEGAVIRYSNL